MYGGGGLSRPTEPNTFAFPRSAAELQTDFFGGRLDTLDRIQYRVEHLCVLVFSTVKEGVSPSHGQCKKNKGITYYRKSLIGQYYGSVQSIAFCVFMSLGCVFLDINAVRLWGREVLSFYSFVLSVHVSASTCSQIRQEAHSLQK